MLDPHGQPEPVPVKTGLSDANRVEAAAGNLTEGQEVITGMAAKPGAPATPTPGTGSSKRFGL